MAEQNIFVYHNADREGRLLAALVRHCNTDRTFRFLAVETPQTVERMHRFLVNHGMHPDVVQLPFVIVLQPGTGGVVRNVMHGHQMRCWLNGVVNALIADGEAAAVVRDTLVLPHLSEPTARLVAFALAPPPPPPPPPVPVPVPEALPPPAPVPEALPPPPPEEPEPDEPPRYLIVDGETGGSRGAVPMKRKEKSDLLGDAQAQSKARERMFNSRSTF